MMSDSEMESGSDYMSESDWGDNDDCEFPEDLVDDSHMSDPFSKTRFVALESGDIVAEQQEAINRVMEITSMPAHMARTFLQQMKWNHEKLAEFYYEDQDRALAKVGLAAKGETISSAACTEVAIAEEKEDIRCEVCFDDIKKEDVSRLTTVVAACRHRFCNDCWRHHLHTQIEDGQAARIRCAGTTFVEGETVSCNVILDDSVVERLLAEEGDEAEMLRVYKRRLMESYVNDNPRVKWCPGTDCSGAVRVTEQFESSSCTTHVECQGGHEWCFVCSGEAHSPARCDMVRSWKKKCQDDSETSNWLQANTKDCPNCRIAINKDGGCNHMHCKQCDTHFCWMCLGPFEHTTYQHNCNKFVQSDDAVNQSRAALERYMHHFTRFQTHAKSRELEAELRESTVSKMTEMQDKGNKTFLEVQFMKDATTQLIQTRRCLQWSYVVGFYQPAWLLPNIFEGNQAELEQATEELSFMFENTEVLELCGDAGRVKLIDQTKKVQKRVESMIGNLEQMRAEHCDADADVELPTDKPEEEAAPDSQATTTTPPDSEQVAGASASETSEQTVAKDAGVRREGVAGSRARATVGGAAGGGVHTAAAAARREQRRTVALPPLRAQPLTS